MGIILHNGYAMSGGNLKDGIHVCGLAIKMDGEDGPYAIDD